MSSLVRVKRSMILMLSFAAGNRTVVLSLNPVV
jgi:hypothetical protein